MYEYDDIINIVPIVVLLLLLVVAVVVGEVVNFK